MGITFVIHDKSVLKSIFLETGSLRNLWFVCAVGNFVNWWQQWVELVVSFNNVAEAKFASRKAQMFLNWFRNIVRPQQM